MRVCAPLCDGNCLTDCTMCLCFRHFLFIITHSRLMDEKCCTSTSLYQVLAGLGVSRITAHRSGRRRIGDWKTHTTLQPSW